MTNLYATVSSRGDVTDLLYSQIAQTNLIYALGKLFQASSSRGGVDSGLVNTSVSNSCLESSKYRRWLIGCETTYEPFTTRARFH